MLMILPIIAQVFLIHIIHLSDTLIIYREDKMLKYIAVSVACILITLYMWYNVVEDNIILYCLVSSFVIISYLGSFGS